MYGRRIIAPAMELQPYETPSQIDFHLAEFLFMHIHPEARERVYDVVDETELLQVAYKKVS